MGEQQRGSTWEDEAGLPLELNKVFPADDSSGKSPTIAGGYRVSPDARVTYDPTLTCSFLYIYPHVYTALPADLSSNPQYYTAKLRHSLSTMGA